MKIQFDAKNNNTQISDDDTTTQIQIGPPGIGCSIVLGIAVIIIAYYIISNI